MAIYQAIKMNEVCVKGVAAATAKTLLKTATFFNKMVGNVEVTGDENTSYISGDLKNYNLDISEFKAGVGGKIYDLIGPYELQYELQKTLGTKITIQQLQGHVKLDGAGKVGDRIEEEYGWM